MRSTRKALYFQFAVFGIMSSIWKLQTPWSQVTYSTHSDLAATVWEFLILLTTELFRFKVWIPSHATISKLGFQNANLKLYLGDQLRNCNFVFFQTVSIFKPTIYHFQLFWRVTILNYPTHLSMQLSPFHLGYRSFQLSLSLPWFEASSTRFKNLTHAFWP